MTDPDRTGAIDISHTPSGRADAMPAMFREVSQIVELFAGGPFYRIRRTPDECVAVLVFETVANDIRPVLLVARDPDAHVLPLSGDFDQSRAGLRYNLHSRIVEFSLELNFVLGHGGGFRNNPALPPELRIESRFKVHFPFSDAIAARAESFHKNLYNV